MSFEPFASISDVRAALAAKRVTVPELIEDTLERAHAFSHLNAFAALDEQGAMSAAAASQSAIDNGKALPLQGVPITIKDLYNVQDFPARGGTKVPLPDLGPAEGTAVQRLRAAGAVIIGTVNMHEVALGLTGENATTGDVKNPLDPERQAGGSSSGSGAVIGAGIGYVSLGSDTGGSVRVPATLCGVMSYKPSFGLVPLDGVLPLAPTCDHAGLITRCVNDARIATEILTGQSLTTRSSGFPAPHFGVPWRFLEGRLGVATRQTFEALLKRVKEAGATISDVDPSDLNLGAWAYTTICWSEATQFHHGAVTSEARDLFSPCVRASLEHGLSVSAVDYIKAQQHRRRIAAGLSAVFASGVEALLLPVTPVPAPIRGTTEVETESGTTLHRDAFLPLVVPFSLAGLPIVSVPYAAVDGLPVGIQAVGARNSDTRVLEIGRWLECSEVLEWPRPERMASLGSNAGTPVGLGE